MALKLKSSQGENVPNQTIKRVQTWLKFSMNSKFATSCHYRGSHQKTSFWGATFSGFSILCTESHIKIVWLCILLPFQILFEGHFSVGTDGKVTQGIGQIDISRMLSYRCDDVSYTTKDFLPCFIYRFARHV